MVVVVIMAEGWGEALMIMIGDCCSEVVRRREGGGICFDLGWVLSMGLLLF